MGNLTFNLILISIWIIVCFILSFFTTILKVNGTPRDKMIEIKLKFFFYALSVGFSLLVGTFIRL
jgi:hypothetical protein